MFFTAEAVAFLRRLLLPPRHLGPCELIAQNQCEGFVGFSLLRNPQNDSWEVDVVYPDTPASSEPRLQGKTTVLKVNGQSAQQMQHHQIKDMMRGRTGSSISITVKKGCFFHRNSCYQARGSDTSRHADHQENRGANHETKTAIASARSAYVYFWF